MVSGQHTDRTSSKRTKDATQVSQIHHRQQLVNGGKSRAREFVERRGPASRRGRLAREKSCLGFNYIYVPVCINSEAARGDPSPCVVCGDVLSLGVFPVRRKSNNCNLPLATTAGRDLASTFQTNRGVPTGSIASSDVPVHVDFFAALLISSLAPRRCRRSGNKRTSGSVSSTDDRDNSALARAD
jgi:hypothetical protein